jgi:acyl carrier protein
VSIRTKSRDKKQAKWLFRNYSYLNIYKGDAMEKVEIINKLNQILCEEILHYQVVISADENFLERYAIDSMGFLNFLYAVQNNFNIEIDDDDWKYNRFKSLDALGEYIKNRSN